MLAFAATSTILLAVMAMAGLQNQSREHRRFQQEFQRLTTDRSSAHASGPRDALDVLQIWLPPFDRTDRCVTCHLGVAEPELRGAALPFGYHSEVAHAPADFNRIGCVSCHAGQGAATTLQEAHGRSGHWAYPLLEGTHIEGRCGRCHLSSAVREAPSLTRGRSLIQRFGCFNCHTAGGRETFPPTAPPLDGLSLKVSRDWLHRWLKNPKAMDRNARMPDFHLTSREIAALSEYLLSLPPHEGVEAAIRRAGIESHGDPAEGARLFRTSRCISCHTLEGKGHGGAPDLSQIGSKTSKAWLLAFMKDTHALNPQTAMPSFALSPAQLRDIVSYMKDDLRDFDAPAQQVVQGPVQTGLVTEGRRVFIRYGCSACHGRREVQHEELGPDLSSVGDGKATSVDFGARRDLPRTLPAWLKAKVTEPRSFGPDLKMPSFALSDGELSDMTAALMSLSKEHVPEEFKQRTYWTVTPAVRPPPGDVGRLFAKYRCLACHLIGDEGTDLSTAPLTFQGSKTKREWLAQYLLLPETIYPLLTERMPVLGMTPEEAKQIADFISTVYVEDGIGGERVLTRGPAEANGARLFRDKGCRSCHIVGQTGGYVGPPLSAAGDRLQGAWIAFWLENPQRWRRQARCPNYGLSQEEVGDLTAFLSSQTAGAHRP